MLYNVREDGYKPCGGDNIKANKIENIVAVKAQAAI